LTNDILDILYFMHIRIALSVVNTMLRPR